MQVTVLAFGVLRDALGAEQRLQIPDLSTVADVVDHLALRGALPVELWQSVAAAVNQHYVNRAHVLLPDDELALLPPVSGGSLA